MVHDRNAVAREMYVELEPVRAGGEPAIEGGHRVFGTQRTSAAMSEHERPRAAIER